MLGLFVVEEVSTITRLYVLLNKTKYKHKPHVFYHSLKKTMSQNQPQFSLKKNHVWHDIFLVFIIWYLSKYMDVKSQSKYDIQRKKNMAIIFIRLAFLQRFEISAFKRKVYFVTE